MALQLEKELPAGYTASYWRVDEWHIVRKGMRMEARLNLYKSKADRDGSKESTGLQFTVSFDIPKGNPTLSQLVAASYEAAKLDEFFTGAIDV
jgi:hypothetical protein